MDDLNHIGNKKNQNINKDSIEFAKETQNIKTSLIERDRNLIRNSIGQESICLPSEFSYLHFLVQKNQPLKVKLSKLSTLNILVYLEEGFLKNDKFVYSNLDKIKREITSRADLFESILKYLHNKNVRDDLYYWTPGHSISNIFSFITEICPDFVKKYKKYYIECVVCQREFYNLLQFVKERYSDDYEEFKVIEIDLNIFKQCVTSNFWVDSNEEDTTNSRSGMNMISDSNLSNFRFNHKFLISEKSAGIYPDYLVTADYCIENILNIRKTVYFSDDIEADLIESISFLEITVNNNFLTVSLEAFVGLMLKDCKYEEYWKERGVNYQDMNNLFS